MSKETIKVIAGIDGGNNSIKIYFQTLNAGSKSIIKKYYENIYCERIDSEMKSEYKLSGTDFEKLSDILDVKVVSNKDDKERINSFLFSDIAYRKYEGKIKDRKTNIKKSKDMQLIHNSLVALTNSVIEDIIETEEIKNDELDLEVYLCTGLPFKEYLDDDSNENYKKLFMGNHKIEFLHPKYPVKIVNVDVQKVMVEIEGMAALRKTIAEDRIEGNPEKIISMIDIGCFTTDIATGIFKLKNDKIVFNPLANLSDGINEGVVKVIDFTINALKAEYTFGQHGKINRKQVQEALKTENMILGENISINPFYSEESNRLGKEIAEVYDNMLDRCGYTSRKIQAIYLSGGGSKEEHIIDGFKEFLDIQEYDLDTIKKSKDPVYANAKGYFGWINAYATQKKLK